jgi:acyl carrier protein
MQPETPLFGSMPEFDSLAIVEVVALVEERFGFEVDEADITGEVFESVGSLAAYVDANRS